MKLEIKALLELGNDYVEFHDASFHGNHFSVSMDEFIAKINPFVIVDDGVTIERRFINDEGDEDFEKVGSILGGDGDVIWFEAKASLFTGFHDINKRKIYDGAALREFVATDEGNIESIRKVCWDAAKGTWALRGHNILDELWSELRDFELEIIW